MLSQPTWENNISLVDNQLLVWSFCVLTQLQFNSLACSVIGDTEATALADSLRVNQSLRTLRYSNWAQHDLLYKCSVIVTGSNSWTKSFHLLWLLACSDYALCLSYFLEPKSSLEYALIFRTYREWSLLVVTSSLLFNIRKTCQSNFGGEEKELYTVFARSDAALD